MQPIRTSRTAVETRQLCRHKRFLSTHLNGKGITKRGTGYERNLGQVIHTAMSKALTPYIGGLTQYATAYVPDEEVAELCQIIDTQFGDNPHMKLEQEWLLRFLVEGWQRYRLPHILRKYTIINVEQEKTALFDSSKYLPANLAAIMRPYEMPLRLDMLVERKSDGVLEVGDFKTCREANSDWNITLDNSNQSHLYCEAVETIYERYMGGIFYEGLVKGFRKRDDAQASEFNGQTIQYGSVLYGWKNKKGECDEKYVKGKVRVFLPTTLGWNTIDDLFRWINREKDVAREYFPTTQTYRPLDSAAIVGQTIVNENRFQQDLDTLNNIPAEHPEHELVKNVLFERSLNSGCFKYGLNHKCDFVGLCLERMSPEEVAQQFEPRVDHHGDE